MYRYIKFSSTSTIKSTDVLNIENIAEKVLRCLCIIDKLEERSSIDFRMDYKQRYEKLKRRVKYFVLVSLTGIKMDK